MRIGSIALFLTMAVAGLTSSSSPAGAQGGPWRQLFDGRTLEGWYPCNGTAPFTVEDGAIVGRTVVGSPNSFLCSKETFGDFILEYEAKIDSAMNSGVMVRGVSDPAIKNGRVNGYQVEIDPSERAWSGGIYDEGRRGWLFDLKDKPQAQAAFKQGQWNHYRIEAIGNRIRTWVNGELRQDSNTHHLIFDVPAIIEYVSDSLPAQTIPASTWVRKYQASRPLRVKMLAAFP